MKRWPILHFTGFLLLWAVPMWYYGLSNHSAAFLPAELRIYYRIAALFTERTPDWYDRHIQVRSAAGSQWVTLNVSRYDGLGIYGYGNRIDRVLSMLPGKAAGRVAFADELAEYIARRHRHLFPDAPPLQELRFITVRWPVGKSVTMSHPPGRWEELPPEMADPKQIRVVSTHRLKLPPGVPAEQELRMEEQTGAWLAAELAAKDIHTLNLTQARNINTQTLRPVWQEKTIHTLSLRGVALSSSDVMGLLRLPALRELNLESCRLPEGAELALGTLKELQVLRLRQTPLGNAFPEAIMSLAQLRVLDLGYSKASGRVLRYLAWWPVLEELSLAGATQVRENLTNLKGGTLLKKLDLSGTSLTDAEVKPLHKLPAVYRVILDQNALTDAALPVLKEWKSLTQISVQNCQLSSEALQTLSTWPALAFLRTEKDWRNLKNERAGKGGVKPLEC